MAKFDLTGQVFGLWTVLHEAEPDKSGRARWLCRCQCGKERVVTADNLRSGKSTSCGHTRFPKLRADLTGQRFGRLTALEYAGSGGKRNSAHWRCRCDCGNTCTVEDSHLKNGHTKSCGCRRRIRLQEKRLDLTGQRYGRLVVLGPAAGTAEKCDGAVEQSGSSEGDRADRPVIAEYTEEKTTDGEHPLAFRESPTILAASQPMRRQFRRGWTRKSGYMIHF